MGLSIRLKLLLSFILLFAIAFTLSAWWFYRLGTEVALDSLRTNLIGLASAAARGIDPEAHRRIASGELNEELYREIINQLRIVRDSNPSVATIYTMTTSSDPTKLLWVTEADTASEDSQEVVQGRPPYDISNAPQMLEAFNAPTADSGIETDEWGSWFSGYAPIFDEQGQAVGIVGVDMSAQDVIDVQRRIRTGSVYVAGTVFSLLVVVVSLISFVITRSLKQITEAARDIEQGNAFDPASLENISKTRDEIGRLATVFAQMSQEVCAREQRLKQEVLQLKIEIDEVKRQKEVSEIVDTDFFRDLQKKARAMRSYNTLRPDRETDRRQSKAL